MAYINDEVRDQGLDWAVANATDLVACSQEPTTAGEVSTYEIARKAGVSITGPADDSGGGRKITVEAFDDGSLTSAGTASHWALVGAADLLVATGSMDSPVTLGASDLWRMTADLDISIGDAVDA